jgi:hypothetical protein
MSGWCDETQTAYRVGMHCNGLAEAEFIEDQPPLGRNRAAACLVARKHAAVDNDHSLDAKLGKMQCGSQSGRTGADDSDVGVDCCTRAADGPSGFNHACSTKLAKILPLPG